MYMPLSNDDRVEDRVTRACSVLLATHRSLAEWSRDAVDALRGLTRAREAALLVARGGQWHVAGDERPVALLEHLCAHADHRGAGRSTVRIGWSAAIGPRVPTTRDPAPPGQRGGLDGPSGPDGDRYDVAWRLVALADAGALLGTCCVFVPDVSARTARGRAHLLESAWPSLEAAVRSRICRWGGREEQHHLLHGLHVPAALCARDGTVLDLNPPLARLLAADGQRESLRAAVSRAASGAAEARIAPAEDLALVHTRHGRYQVRTRMLSEAPSADAPCLLVLVEPAIDGVDAAMRSDEIERLRHRFRLTERECDVARLLRLGHSNVAIAATLGISPNTARHHTERVLAKLGVPSRAAIHRTLLDDVPEVRWIGVEAHPGAPDGPERADAVASRSRQDRTTPRTGRDAGEAPARVERAD